MTGAERCPHTNIIAEERTLVNGHPVQKYAIFFVYNAVLLWVESLRPAARPPLFRRVLDKRGEMGYNRHKREIFRGFSLTA